MKYQAIIFDLDGVICSTDEYHYLAWKALADRLGIPFDRTINNRLRGVSRMESLEIILEKAAGEYTLEEKAASAEEKNTLYRELLHQQEYALHPGAHRSGGFLRGSGGWQLHHPLQAPSGGVP